MFEVATAFPLLSSIGTVLGMALAILWLATSFVRALVGIFCLLVLLPMLRGLRAILTWVQDRRAMRG